MVFIGLEIQKPKVEEKFKSFSKTLDKSQLNRVLDSSVIGSVDDCIRKIEDFMDAGLNYLIFQSNNTLKDLEKSLEKKFFHPFK